MEASFLNKLIAVDRIPPVAANVSGEKPALSTSQILYIHHKPDNLLIAPS